MLAAQCGIARTILDLTVEQLAEKAGVTPDMILRIEADAPLEDDILSKVQGALEAEGIEFTSGARPGVKVRTLDGIIEISASTAAKPVSR